MARIASRVLKIPFGVAVKLISEGERNFLEIVGPKGKSPKIFLPPESEVGLIINPEEIKTIVQKNKSLAGTLNALVCNSLKGAFEGYNLALEIRGVGYKVEKKELENSSCLLFNLGKSHLITKLIPSFLTVAVSTNQRKIEISGIDKQEVGLFASQIRLLKKPGAYHDKGIYYLGEVRKLKPTKSVSKKTS